VTRALPSFALTSLLALAAGATARGQAGSVRTGPSSPIAPDAGPRSLALSALPWVFAQGGHGPVETDASAGGPAAGDGGPLTVGGRVFAHGLGTAATSVITFDLRGEASSLSSWVGVDDEVGAGAGSVVFQVLADGVKVFDSGPLTGADPALSSGELDVRGVHELQLVVTDAGDGHVLDHADWGEPTLTVPVGGRPGGEGAASRHLRGRWEPALEWPVKAMHAALLPAGHILSFASADPDWAGSDSPADPHDSTRADLAEIATWSHRAVDHPTRELFGSGLARGADGALVVVGGHGGRDAARVPFGRVHCSRFDLATSSWIPGADMAQARWGPGALSLGSGDVLALGGAHAGGNGFLPEVFDGRRWRTLADVDYSTWLDGGDPEFDHTVPFAHLASDGRVFQAGWDEDMAFLDLTGNGAFGSTFRREPIQRLWGSSVLYRTDRILMVGGVDHRGTFGDARRAAITIDLAAAPPRVLPAGSMLFPRADLDLTLLADGSVLASGGAYHHTEGADPTHVRVPEIWDPSTRKWRVAAAAAHPRGYRSATLLLPDGRVWSAGGECGAGCPDGGTAQVFDPPYLFTPASQGELAPRPVIDVAPAALAYGADFDVTLGTGGAASRVTLLRLGSVTHGVDRDQRFLELAFVQVGRTLSVSAPANGNLAPPGHYSLFVFDAAGVPSVGALVRLSRPSPSTWELFTATDGSAPENRHEAAMVELGGKLYLMGGRGARRVQELDPVRGTWTDKGFPPLQMHHFQPVAFEGRIWVVGAFVGDYPSETPVPDIHVYDPASDSWSLGPPMPAAPAARNRGSAGTVVYEGKFYLAGGNTRGHDGGYVPWLDVFDPASGAWTALPDAPRARDHFVAAVVGNKLVAAGGRRTDLPDPFDKTIAEVDVYDFGAGVWTTYANDIPTPRGGTMAAAVGPYVVVAGGESSAMSEAHAETEALDVLTGEWHALPRLVEDRHSGGLAEHGGRIWVAAGSGRRGGSPELDSVEVLGAADLLAGVSTNRLANPGFDAGLASWERSGAVELSSAAGIASPALAVRPGSASQTVPATPATGYRLGVLYRAPAGAGTVAIAVQFLNEGGVQIGQQSAVLPAATALTSASVAGTSPPGTAFARAFLFAGGSRVLTVDDVVLTAD